EQIKAVEKYVKQPGVDGSVFLHFLKEYKEGDFILYDDTKNVVSQFANILGKEKSSALIDSAPAFPGLTADKIANLLANKMPDKLIRYTDKDEQVVVLNTSTREIVPEGQVTLEEVHTILDKAQTRGTHTEMADNCIGFLPVNKLTTAT